MINCVTNYLKQIVSCAGATFFFVSLICFGIYECNAQDKKVTHNNQQWAQYYLLFKINQRFTILGDAGLRRKDVFTEWSQSLIRSGVSYSVAENYLTALGFACFFSYKDNKANRRELRPYQEFTASFKKTNFTIQHRLRIEERFFSGINENKSASHNFNFRFRYRLYLTIPFSFIIRSDKPSRLLVNLGDELFVNAGKQVVYNTLDNNRLIFGPSYRINKQCLLSLFYVYQYGQRSAPDTYEQANIFWLTFTHSILKKK